MVVTLAEDLLIHNTITIECSEIPQLHSRITYQLDFIVLVIVQVELELNTAGIMRHFR